MVMYAGQVVELADVNIFDNPQHPILGPYLIPFHEWVWILSVYPRSLERSPLDQRGDYTFRDRCPDLFNHYQQVAKEAQSGIRVNSFALLDVNNLQKTTYLKRARCWAKAQHLHVTKNVSLKLEAGKTLAIVGNLAQVNRLWVNDRHARAPRIW